MQELFSRTDPMFWILLAFGLMMFLSLMRRGMRMAAGKELTSQARVVETWRDPPSGSGKTGESHGMAAFDTGGFIVRLRVDEAVWKQLEPGQTGQLTWQSGRLTRFEAKQNR